MKLGFWYVLCTFKLVTESDHIGFLHLKLEIIKVPPS